MLDRKRRFNTASAGAGISRCRDWVPIEEARPSVDVPVVSGQHHRKSHVLFTNIAQDVKDGGSTSKQHCV
jgi:hypothetical protein